MIRSRPAPPARLQRSATVSPIAGDDFSQARKSLHRSFTHSNTDPTSPTRRRQSDASATCPNGSLTRQHTDSGYLEDHNNSPPSMTSEMTRTFTFSPSTGGDCPKHPHERLKYYCQLHDELVCADCLALEQRHQGHRHTRAEDLADEYRGCLAAQLKPITQFHEQAERALEDMRSHREEIVRCGESVKEEISVHVERLREMLDSRLEELLVALSKATQQKLKHHDGHQGYLDGVRAQLANLIEKVSQATSDNSGDILYLHKQLVDLVVEENKKLEALPKEVFMPLQGASLAFSPDPLTTETCQIVGTISDKQADPEKSYIDEWTARGLTANQPGCIQIVVLDSNGQPYPDHVKGLKVEVRSTKTNSTIEATIVRETNQSNRYDIHFTPTDACSYELRARFGNTTIRNSPLVVNVSALIVGSIVGEIKGVLQPNGIAVTDTEVVIVENGKDCVSVFRHDGKQLRSITGKGTKKLNRPRGVALIPSGHLLISDEDGLKQCTVEGKQLTALGKPGSGPMEFNCPGGIAVKQDGSIYICDTYNKRVQILNPDTSFQGIMGTKLNAPYDIAINTYGELFVADYNDHCIKVFSSSGQYERQFSDMGERGTLRSPVSIHIDQNDHVFVGEEKGSGVAVFDKNGHFLTYLSAKATGVFGIGTDREGQVYVCDRSNRKVHIFK